MDLRELLLKSMEGNVFVQKNFIQEMEEDIDLIVEIPQDEQEFKKMVLEYMNAHGIELSQSNYDYVVELLHNNQDNQFHKTVKKKKQINALEELSLEDLKDILQVCILKQCESLCDLMESNNRAKYEYAVERIMDDRGSTDVILMSSVIASYAEKGWRVKNIFTNELGHNSSTVGVGMVSSGVNYTSDEVVVVFERRIMK